MPPRVRLEVDINLPGVAFLPEDYVPDLRLKIDLYRRLARVSRYEELEDFRSELVDRFGEPPPPVERLLSLAELKMDAASWQVSAIFVENEFVVFRYDNRQRIDQLARQHKGKLRIVDDKSAYLPLPKDLTETERVWRIVKSLLRPPQ
jgi:transcription-repair coupling factor (superfamily II helicase)